MNSAIYPNAHSKGVPTVPVILAAVDGNTEAICAIIKHYQGYIKVLSTKRFYDKDGKMHFLIDEDLRQELEIRLTTKILNFKPQTF
jgi:hypothetical protein